MTFEQKIKRIVSEELHVEEHHVVPEAHILHDLAADSLDAVVPILALDDAYHITIPDDEAKNLHTIGHMIKCIHRKLINQLLAWRRKPRIPSFALQL